jgi:hypothetical protein
MAKNEIEYLSKNAYAQYLGVSEKAVRNAITDGKIKKGFDLVRQKVIKHLADKEYGHLHSVAKARPGINKDKLAVRINEANRSDKNVQNSAKSEVVVKKSASPKKPSKKSEVSPGDDDDEEPADLQEYSYEQLMEKIKITPSLSYSESLRRKSILDLAAEKMKAEIQQNLYVRRSDVEAVLYEFGSHLKKALMSMPLRIADELLNAGEVVSVVNTMNRELTDILNEYSNFEEVNFIKD